MRLWAYLEHGLLILGEGVLTNELHDFSQLIFLLENLFEGFSEGHELGLSLGVVLTKNSIVVGEGNVPVDRREMLTLGKLLIQTPKDLHNRKGG